jgi:hypothetical protein
VRRERCAKGGFASAAQRDKGSWRAIAKNPAGLPLSYTLASLLFTPTWLTKRGAHPYIEPLGRAAARRDGASAKPLTVHTVTEHPAMLFVAMFASLRRVCGLLLPWAFVAQGDRTNDQDDGAAKFRAV